MFDVWLFVVGRSRNALRSGNHNHTNARRSYLNPKSSIHDHAVRSGFGLKAASVGWNWWY